MTKYNPVSACEQCKLPYHWSEGSEGSEQRENARANSTPAFSSPLASLLFTISPKWRVYSQANPVQNLQKRFLYTFSRFSICCSVKSSDEEDLWWNCHSTGRAPSSRIWIPLNILHLLTLCFLPTILSFYRSSKWRTPDLYTSRPHIVRRSWYHKCV